MTSQPWATASKLAAQRTADLQRLAVPRRRVGGSGREAPGRIALVAGRTLVAAGWRLGGTGALPASLRRRLA
jgi:hypothetical protein